MSDPNTDKGTADNSKSQVNAMDELMKQMFIQKMFEANSNNDNKKVDNNLLLTSLLPALVTGFAEAKDINFVLECDVEGEQRGDKFEPKVKIHLQLGRDMDKVLARIGLESRIEKDKIDSAIEIENTKKYTEAIERIITNVGTPLAEKFTETGIKAGEGVKDENAHPDTHS